MCRLVALPTDRTELNTTTVLISPTNRTFLLGRAPTNVTAGFVSDTYYDNNKIMIQCCNCHTLLCLTLSWKSGSIIIDGVAAIG